jgi:hypothetical protein
MSVPAMSERREPGEDPTADELQVATSRSDGALRVAVPIWAVVVDGCVFVRIWSGRDSGWFGHAASSSAARIAVPGLEVDVTVNEVGSEDLANVDAAYRVKYWRFGARRSRGWWAMTPWQRCLA